METPAAEVIIDEPLVKRLLEEQHPDLAHLPLQYLSEGWDNSIYRLGTDYLVRIPRRAIAVPLLQREQEWLAALAPLLPISISAPIHLGKPQGIYPWPWSVTPWFAGKMAAEQQLQDKEAVKLAHFLSVLHNQPIPNNPPHNPHRSAPLSAKSEGTKKRIQTYIRNGLVAPKVAALWAKAVVLACPAEARRLIHGDLHPKNIVAKNGQITAIIDWGDFALGDPATDLAIFWMLFSDKKIREEALQTYGAEAPLIKRAIGWAIFFGTILLDVGQGGDELFYNIGTLTLANIETEDWPEQ